MKGCVNLKSKSCSFSGHRDFHAGKGVPRGPHRDGALVRVTSKKPSVGIGIELKNVVPANGGGKTKKDSKCRSKEASTRAVGLLAKLMKPGQLLQQANKHQLLSQNQLNMVGSEIGCMHCIHSIQCLHTCFSVHTHVEIFCV